MVTLHLWLFLISIWSSTIQGKLTYVDEIPLDDANITFVDTRNIEIIQYSLTLKPDTHVRVLDGSVEIKFKLAKDVDQLAITNNVSIKAVELNSDSVNFSIDHENHVLDIDSRIPSGIHKILITFSEKIKTKNFRGLVCDPKTHILETVLQPGYAHYMFPCFENPAHRAEFILTIDYTMVMFWNDSYYIAASANLNKSTDREITFMKTPKIPVDSLQFFISSYPRVPVARNIDVIGQQSHFSNNRSKFAENLIPSVINKLSSLLNSDILKEIHTLNIVGSPFYCDRISVSLGCIIAHESHIFTNESFELESKYMIARNLTHALAKLWFGNLVTVAWRSHVWFSEGIAKLLQLKVIDDVFPDWKTEALFLAEDVENALSADCCGKQFALSEYPITYYEFKEKLSSIHVAKGTAVVRMLYYWLTPEQFLSICKNILQKHKFGSLDYNALNSYFNFNKIFKSFHDRGYPIIFVHQVGGNTLELIQIAYYDYQKTPGLYPHGLQEKTWSMPIAVHYIPLGKTHSIETTLWINSTKTPVLYPFETVPIVNSQGMAYCRVNYSKKFWESIALKLKSQSFGGIDELSRVTIVRDLAHFTMTKDIKMEYFLRWTLFARNETSYAVWKSIGKVYKRLLSVLQCSKTGPLLKNYMEHMVEFLPLVLDESELSYPEFLKNDYFASLICLVTERCNEAAQQIAGEYFEGGHALKGEKAIALFCAAGRSKNDTIVRQASAKIGKNDEDEHGKQLAWAVIACYDKINTFTDAFRVSDFQKQRYVFTLVPSLSCKSYAHIIKYFTNTENKLSGVPSEYLLEFVQHLPSLGDDYTALETWAATSEFKKLVPELDLGQRYVDLKWGKDVADSAGKTIGKTDEKLSS